MGSGSGKNKRVNLFNLRKPKQTKINPETGTAANSNTKVKTTIYPGIMEADTGEYFVEKNGDKYYFGNLTTLEQAKELNDADPRLDFQDGDCGILANDLWNLNDEVEDYYYFQTDMDPDIGIHQFVKLKNGNFVDSMGVWNEDALFAQWKQVDPSIKLITWVEGHPEDADTKRDPSHKPYAKRVVSVLNEIIEDKNN